MIKCILLFFFFFFFSSALLLMSCGAAAQSDQVLDAQGYPLSMGQPYSFILDEGSIAPENSCPPRVARDLSPPRWSFIIQPVDNTHGGILESDEVYISFSQNLDSFAGCSEGNNWKASNSDMRRFIELGREEEALLSTITSSYRFKIEKADTPGFYKLTFCPTTLTSIGCQNVGYDKAEESAPLFVMNTDDSPDKTLEFKFIPPEF